MSLNPLNELKRRLHDNDTPLPKRFCLAKNVVQSHHFPAAPKERVVAEWLNDLSQDSKLSSTDLNNVLGWLNVFDDLTTELKSKLIQIVAQYVQKNQLKNDEIECILSFIENDKIATQLIRHVDEFLITAITLLQHLKHDDVSINIPLCQRTFNNLIKYYKQTKKKLELVIKFLDGQNLETIFSYLDTECKKNVTDVCQTILFPANRKTFFINFLQTIVRKDNIDELIAEKGDNIQSVLKIMSAFFTFPKGRTAKDQSFLCNFINVFVSSYHSESQLIFAFYIMACSSLNMPQNYLNPNMVMPPIIFEANDDKIKRNIFLDMLEILLQNEVDINVRLTDTFGEKLSKVEIKKNFSSFLQAVMMGQLKLEHKVDKITMEILSTAIKLDPTLIEGKMDQILPSIMIAKKNNSHLPVYITLLNCLLEIFFKLSRGTLFLNQILPNVKLRLEAGNTEQFKLNQKLKESIDNGKDCEKIRNKIIYGEDIFPRECVEMYGKLTSELMFRQNSELLTLLQKDFEEHCVMMLEEGFVSPSIIILTEVLSAILCSFFQHNKMADHTVPGHIAQDFWNAFQKYEHECLKKFGESILKLNYNPSLVLSFLKQCLGFSQMKLLNMKYSNTRLDIAQVSNTSEVFDLSSVLPCLSSEQWISFASRIQNKDAIIILNNLVLIKTMIAEMQSIQHSENKHQSVVDTKSYLIKQLSTSADILESNSYYANVLFAKLDKTQYKLLAKSLVKSHVSNSGTLFKSDAVSTNRLLLNALVIEVLKNLTKCLENNESLHKVLSKTDFDITYFVNELNVKEYFNKISIKDENHDGESIDNYLELLKQLQTPYLEEKYQLSIIFVLLLLKKCSSTKKNRRNIDHLLQSIYELCPKYPDVYKMLPVNFIFSFEDKIIINLLTLKIKTSNPFLIIKCILETAVKKVKTDNQIVKYIVEILLSKQNSNLTSIEYFNNTVFQITCIILPIIAKEKKAITTSAYRSVLANLQENLHKAILESFKNIDFTKTSSFISNKSVNIEDDIDVSESNIATLNAIDAYSLTLSKYCETTDVEIKNLNCLWSGLDFFIQHAIQTIQNPESKTQHIDSSIHLLNVTLRHIKKLDSHEIFQNKDKLFIQIWQSIKSRLLLIHDERQKVKRKLINDGCLEDISVTLKFICELTSVSCFNANVAADLTNLAVLKKPSSLEKEKAANYQLTSHKVSKYLWTNCLKANIVGQKCVAMSKVMHRTCKNLRFWIEQHYESTQNGVEIKNEKDQKVNFIHIQNEVDNDTAVNVIKIEDAVCELLKLDLDTLSEAILAAKKITIDYKFLDAIFELQHLIQLILGNNIKRIRCEISWRSYFKLHGSSIAVLNSLIVSREQLLEDRWPNYMQCYRALISCLCNRATSQTDQPERWIEEKLAETAHCMEKLTQSMCKRKTHMSRLATYTVADICSLLERTAPSRLVRQHLENCVALLIQTSDANHAIAFLKRGLAGSPGQSTMSNLYTMYKRYHKYVGNA